MDKIYNALDVAAYCVNHCIDIDRPVSNLQLQKILYYVQANFLCKKDRPCFKQEIVHWQYGGAVVEVYEEYKCNVASPIRIKKRFHKQLKYLNGKFVDCEKAIEKVCQEDLDLVFDVCDRFSEYNRYDLITRVHNESPWKDTNYGEIITTESIKDYFMKNKDRL